METALVSVRCDRGGVQGRPPFLHEARRAADETDEREVVGKASGETVEHPRGDVVSARGGAAAEEQAEANAATRGDGANALGGGERANLGTEVKLGRVEGLGEDVVVGEDDPAAAAVADVVRGSAAMFRGGECGLVRGDRAGAGSAGAGSGVAGSLLYSVPEKHRLGGEALGQDGLVRESRALKRGQVIHEHRGGAWRGGDVAEDAWRVLVKGRREQRRLASETSSLYARGVSGRRARCRDGNLTRIIRYRRCRHVVVAVVG